MDLSKQLSVKLQQLDGMLKLLTDIDKEILDKCEVNEKSMNQRL